MAAARKRPTKPLNEKRQNLASDHPSASASTALPLPLQMIS